MPRLNEEQVLMLLKVLGRTQDQELTCDDCLPHLAALVEHELAGMDPPQAAKLVNDHLAICPECVEELEVLRAAIAAVKTGDE